MATFEQVMVNCAERNADAAERQAAALEAMANAVNHQTTKLETIIEIIDRWSNDGHLNMREVGPY